MSKRKAKHFRILGIHPLNPIVSGSFYLDLDRATSIHKALMGKYEWFMFYQGIFVDKTTQYIKVDRDAMKDFSLYDTDDLKISISAIVGRNGSGKSTIIELIVRAINNLSAALLGEGFNYSKAEHLHYIDDVYVELLFQIESKFYILSVKGRQLSIKHYKKTSFHIRSQEFEEFITENRDGDSRNKVLPRYCHSLDILRSFFYTLVCNYSLYGFNYRDYYIESTPINRLDSIGVKVTNEQYCEDFSWLKGLFHKNDGYQTPIVLHPMRNDGQLDIIKENQLAKERMLSMLFYKDEDGEYPMRTINGNLMVSEIVYHPTKNRKFSKDFMLKTLGITYRQNIYSNFEHIYNAIYSFWDSRYHLSKFSRKRKYYLDACDYLVYKTLKTIRTYKRYSQVYRYLSSKYFNAGALSSKLIKIDSDKTHVTKKIRQTINYIISPRFNDLEGSAFVEDFGQSYETTDNNKEDNPVLFLPPPIFDTDLVLEKDLGFVDESGFVLFNNDRSANVRKVEIGAAHEFRFSGLSSGEKQIAYTISNIVYHMSNVDSEWADVETNKERKNEVQYKYMNLILDEVELYFHPEMQRCFLFLLLKTIRSIKFKNLRGINILFATHSPFILSDIPGTNILHLNENNSVMDQTFGGNIMKMLSSSFYMDSSIGEFARTEICKIAAFMKKAKSEEVDLETLAKEYKEKKARFMYVCSIIGDQFLKMMTENMLEAIENKIGR